MSERSERSEYCTHPGQAWCDCDACRVQRDDAKLAGYRNVCGVCGGPMIGVHHHESDDTRTPFYCRCGHEAAEHIQNASGFGVHCLHAGCHCRHFTETRSNMDGATRIHDYDE